MRMLKWTGLVLLGLVVLAVGWRLLRADAVNAQVAEELRTRPDGERAQRVMLLTLADGTVYPVNYLHEGDRVFVGVDGLWWRRLQGEGQPVTVLVRGRQLTGRGKVVLDDPAHVDAVFARLRPAWPAWLPAWLNGKLVVIELDS